MVAATVIVSIANKIDVVPALTELMSCRWSSDRSALPLPILDEQLSGSLTDAEGRE